MYQAFKKDSKGKIRVIQFLAEGSRLVQRSGLQDGALVEHIKECSPKNVGKANATTAEEQAEKEAIAKWEKRLKEGYFKTEKEAETVEVIKPMLAIEYEKAKAKIKYPLWVQPKLDGMRCLAFCNGDNVVLRSRDNKVIETLPHIVEALKKGKFNCVFDGELYAHGKGFQDNMKLIKKNRPESVEVKYHIYDLVENTDYDTRYQKLKLIPADISNIITRVVRRPAKSIEEIKVWHAAFTKDGYEGLMIRWGDEGYQKNKRSSYLVKYKEFDDIALTIEDIRPMEARPTWGMVICELEGEEVKATPKMSHEDREDLLINKDKYIGQTAEIRYFGKTDEGLLRFPVCMGIRLDK